MEDLYISISRTCPVMVQENQKAEYSMVTGLLMTTKYLESGNTIGSKEGKVQ